MGLQYNIGIAIEETAVVWSYTSAVIADISR